MQGDFSRWTFDKTARFRSVLLQQGRVLLDADWNEQVEITAHHDETRALDTFGRSGVPSGGEDSFRITDTAGKGPKSTAWADLRISPGRMYVDGVLVEAHGEPGGIPLGNQPDLAATDVGTGLTEPHEDGRWAFYLDVHTHHVTMDEEERLRESALGGPDTTTRARTVWQVRYREVKNPTTKCSNLHKPTWLAPDQGTMAASLAAEVPSGDPCDITAPRSYTRLENQLYRVQIHETGKNFLWSRENGSVTALLEKVTTADLPAGVHAELFVDRVGRDEDLSIGHDDIVEVTSPSLQLAGKPGYLARVVNPDGRRLPVKWLSGAGTGVKTRESLGPAPVVRRWESKPLPLTTTKTRLEGGICVQFYNEDKLQTGEHWLIPARAARLAYGLTAANGSLEWPEGDPPVRLPPHGPTRHVAPLAILRRDSAGGATTWTQESDCRLIAPTLTQLTTIDLIGGDGQEALPGEELPHAVRVVVRNGGLPVEKASVLFTPQGGTVSRKKGGTPLPPDRPIRTDEDGVAEAWWTPDKAGAHAQKLEVRRLDNGGAPTDALVVVTGRLSTADGVAWNPPGGCASFTGSKTVQEALETLVTTRELRLLGGDGQHLLAPQKVLPQQVRVIVDSACGPVDGAEVTATATTGAFVRGALPGGTRPTDLTGAADTATAVTEADGSAAFWWQPAFGPGGADTLAVRQEGDTHRAPVVVTAQAAPGGTSTAGIHIMGLTLLADPSPFQNDEPLTIEQLVRGIRVDFDAPIDFRSFFDAGQEEEPRFKPVWRVLLDLPWPLPGEVPAIQLRDGEGTGGFFGFRTVTVDTSHDVGEWSATSVVWRAASNVETWLDRLFDLMEREGWGRPVEGRFQIDGWAVTGRRGPGDREIPYRYLNGHAEAHFEGNRTRLRPTDDAIPGGRFDQWFRLVRE